jgi:hypothetical protein
MDRIRFRDGAVVRGHFFRTARRDAESEVESGLGPGAEVIVSVEGEYEAYPETTYYPSGPSTDHFVGFHLRFHHEIANDSGSEPTYAGLWDTEFEVRQNRVLTDTTANKFRTYRTYAEWRDDPGRDRTNLSILPSMAMFISLALTEDQILEYVFHKWLHFETGQVRVITGLGEGGSEFWVLGATRSMPNGDLEEWTFWFDEQEFPRRIELTLTNEAEPGRGVRGAVLEISEIGDCLPGVPCRE